jgi:ribonuclease P protein subunit POP4
MLAKIKVVASKNPSLVGLQGIIIDETKNTLKIKTLKKGIKTLIKDQSSYEIELEGNAYNVDGASIVGKLEERIKKWRKKHK